MIAAFLYLPVGVSLLAKSVNDNAFIQDAHVVCVFFAGKFAPTAAVV